MKKRSIVFGLVLAVGIALAMQSAWAAQPVMLSVETPHTKVGSIGDSGDLFTSGHHAMAVYGEDIYTTWYRREKAQGGNGSVLVTRNGADGADYFRGSNVVESTQNYSQSSMEVDSSGVVHVAWVGNNPRELRYSRAAPNRIYSTPVVLSDSISEANWGPSVAAGNNDIVYIAYTGRLQGFNYELYILRSFDAGLTWDAPILVNDWTQAYWSGSWQPYSRQWQDNFPSIAADSSGKVHLSFAWGHEKYYTNSSDNGANWSDPVSVTGSLPYSGDDSSISTINGTDIYISWVQSNENITYCAVSHEGGIAGSWGEPVALDSVPGTYSGSSSTAVNSDGYVYVSSSIDSKVYLYKSKNGGASWSDPYLVGSGGDSHLAIDNNDKAVIMWRDDDVVLFKREK